MAVISISGPKKSEVAIDAVSEATDTIVVRAGETVSISVDGTYTGTIQLQRSFDGTNFKAIDEYVGAGAANDQNDLIVSVNQFLKLVSTAWTSGSATASLNSSG